MGAFSASPSSTRGGTGRGGWVWEEALLVLAAFTLLQGLASTLLAPNLNKIVEHVQQGTLDFVLLKPIDPQFWLSLRAFSPWGLGDLVLGLGLLLYGGLRLGLSPLDFALFALYFALGAVILYSLWFLLATTSIWFVKIYNVTEVLRGLLGAGRFPVGAYPALYRVFFTFVVPVAFLTTVPAEAALKRGEAPPASRRGARPPPLPPGPGLLPAGPQELHLGEQLKLSERERCGLDLLHVKDPNRGEVGGGQGAVREAEVVIVGFYVSRL